jgi:RimJ/RimL family protein N-acetyltransferase
MLTETIAIRKATLEDVPTLLRFEQSVVETERPFDPTLKPHPNSYYDIPRMIEDPLVQLVVAECGGQLVGCGYARIEASKHYLRHSRHAYLGFMYVEPAWRGKNINQEIIDNLKQWAISNGLTEMRLEVYVENHAAIKAYEKAGFSNLLVQMRMRIGSKQ